MERKNAWETYDKSQEKKVMKLAEQYRQFISTGKTERECVRLTEKWQEKLAIFLWRKH